MRTMVALFVAFLCAVPAAAAENCLTVPLRADDIDRAEVTLVPRHDDPTLTEPGVTLVLTESGAKRVGALIEPNSGRSTCITYHDHVLVEIHPGRLPVPILNAMLVEQGLSTPRALELLLQIVKDNPRARVRIANWM